jgi:hypothetical protein
MYGHIDAVETVPRHISARNSAGLTSFPIAAIVAYSGWLQNAVARIV